MDKNIAIDYGKKKFEAVVNFDQRLIYGTCKICQDHGLETYVIIEEITNVDEMTTVSIHSKVGKIIKEHLLKEFDSTFLCADCAGKPLEITIS